MQEGKNEKKKKDQGQKAKPYTPTQENDARMGEEQKKETGCYLDHLVASYDSHGSYFGGEPIGRAEVEVRVGKLKNGKAAGKDEIAGEMIKG